jgi:hypothetical protein
VHRTSAGIRPHFRGFSPNGGFGVWWLCPPHPALAGNASRWARPCKPEFGTCMKKLKSLPLVFLILLTLIGCISENTPKEDLAAPTTTIPSSTLLPIETIPSSTPLPTETLTLIPAETKVPTPTLYLTPLPTLSFYKTAYLMYEANNICSLPCWWGITPGVTTWTEAKQYIDHFNPSHSFGVEKVINPVIRFTKSTQSEMYVWSVWLPDADTSASVYVEVQDNVVTAIRVTQDLFTLFFPLHRFLEASDKPDMVLVDIRDYNKINHIYNATLYLVYEQKHILVSYAYLGNETANAVNLCLQHLSPGEMHLWSSGVEISTDLSTLKPLDKFSDLDINSFYERFKSKNHQCFDMSKDAWK